MSDPDFKLYAGQQCPEAFQRLVDRHLKGVYSTAVRVLGKRKDLAEDVTQAVFVLLGRKAAVLPESIIPGAWLHRQTVRQALNTLRSEIRRERREQKAAAFHAMNLIPEEEDPTWSQALPHLDKALLGLSQADRQALILRYIDQRPLHEVGAVLGMTANAAQKRISRALEALRRRLSRKGVTLSAFTLGMIMGQSTLEAAPMRTAAEIAAQALTEAGTGTTGTIGTLILTMNTIKALSTGILLGLLTGGSWLVIRENRSFVAVREEPSALPAAVINRPLQSPTDRFSVPARPLNAVALLSEFHKLMREPDTEVIRLKIEALLAGCGREQFAELLSLFEENLNFQERMRLLLPFCRAWASVDAPQALGSLIGTRMDRLPITPQFMAEQAFTHWQKQSPAEARQWLLEHQDAPEFSRCIPAMIKGVAESLLQKSEGDLIQWAGLLEGDDYRKAALSPLWMRYIEDHNNGDRSVELKNLLETFEKLPDQALGRTAFDACSRRWGYFRADEFLKVLKTLGPSESAYQAAMAFAGSQQNARTTLTGGTVVPVTDRMERVAEAERLAGDRNPAEVASGIILQLNDISPEMQDWALPKLVGSEWDAVKIHASRAALNQGNYRIDQIPQKVALTWAAGISDPAVRDPMIYGLYQQWVKSRDPIAAAEAEKFPDGSNWPDSLKAILRKARSE